VNVRAASGRDPRLLPLADAVGIVAFATLGLAMHDEALSPAGYARDVLPLIAGWYGAALAFGAYRRPSWRTLLATWIVGIPAGILLRALVLGRELDSDQAVFLAIALAFTLLFVVGARAALAALSR
jgi:hypothetical protein